MAPRKIWPEPVSRWPSRESRTQPVPSMAACRDGSASTANTVSADVLIVVVAVRVPSVMVAGLRFLWFLTVLRGEVLSCPQCRQRGEADSSVGRHADRFDPHPGA